MTIRLTNGDMPALGRKATPEEQAELDREVAESAARTRQLNERFHAAKKLVRDRRAAHAYAAPQDKPRAQQLLDEAVARLDREGKAKLT